LAVHGCSPDVRLAPVWCHLAGGRNWKKNNLGEIYQNETPSWLMKLDYLGQANNFVPHVEHPLHPPCFSFWDYTMEVYYLRMGLFDLTTDRILTELWKHQCLIGQFS